MFRETIKTAFDYALDISSKNPLAINSIKKIFSDPLAPEKTNQTVKISITSSPIPPLTKNGEKVKFISSEEINGIVTENQIFLTSKSAKLIANKNEIIVNQLCHSFCNNTIIKGIFSIGLIYHLQLHGMCYLHACGIAKKNRHLLIVGDSGTGKSYAAAHAVKKDWKLLADDSLILKKTKDKITAYPFYRDLELKSQEANSPLTLSPKSWPKEKLTKHLQPNEIIFLTTKTKISKSQALAELIKQSPLSIVKNKYISSPLISLLTSLIKKAEIHTLEPRSPRIYDLLT